MLWGGFFLNSDKKTEKNKITNESVTFKDAMVHYFVFIFHILSENKNIKVCCCMLNSRRLQSVTNM